MELSLIKEEILKFKDNSDDKLIINDELTRFQRSDIHEFVKKFGLFSRSVNKSGSTMKCIIVSRSMEDNVEIDSNFIETFSSLSKIPIPVPLPEYFDYFVRETDPYFNSLKMFNMFKLDVKEFGGLSNFRKHIDGVLEKILDNIKSNPDFDEFKQVPKQKAKSDVKNDETPNISKKFYNIANKDKYFVSLDIKSANFTMMKYHYPKLFGENKSWSTYISQFTSSEFIRNCKYIRELIFGKLGTSNRVNTLCINFITKIEKEIREHFTTNHQFKAINMTHDEVIYCLEHDTLEDKIKAFEHLRDFIDGKYKDMFHIKMFFLHQLGTKPYFIKKHINTKDIEFKCCPSKLIMQCIRYWKKEECTQMDLQFMDEGYIAQYLKSIFDAVSIQEQPSKIQQEATDDCS